MHETSFRSSEKFGACTAQLCTRGRRWPIKLIHLSYFMIFRAMHAPACTCMLCVERPSPKYKHRMVHIGFQSYHCHTVSKLSQCRGLCRDEVCVENNAAECTKKDLCKVLHRICLIVWPTLFANIEISGALPK
jgi:hypothetical protein